MLCPCSDTPAKSRSNTSRSSSCRVVLCGCRKQWWFEVEVLPPQKNLVGPVFAKISHPISAQRDRVFRINPFSFRQQRRDGEPTNVYTSATNTHTVLEPPSAARKQENVGLGVGSRPRRNGLLRTSTHQTTVQHILTSSPGSRSPRRPPPLRRRRRSSRTRILQRRVRAENDAARSSTDIRNAVRPPSNSQIRDEC